MSVLILGIGNTIMTDDGVGVLAARRARSLLGEHEPVEVAEAQVAGLALLELIEGRTRVVIVDGMVERRGVPGEIRVLGLDDLHPGLHLASSHEIDLPTALGLGRQMGLEMPDEIHLVAVIVEDARTPGERCTPAVERAIEPAALRALELARG